MVVGRLAQRLKPVNEAANFILQNYIVRVRFWAVSTVCEVFVSNEVQMNELNGIVVAVDLTLVRQERRNTANNCA